MFSDLHTQTAGTRIDNIRLAFGPAVAKELLPLDKDVPELEFSVSGNDRTQCVGMIDVDVLDVSWHACLCVCVSECVCVCMFV